MSNKNNVTKAELDCVLLDVSELEPPEPMTEIIIALARLEINQYLKVSHRREPFPLYQKLVEAGWAYITDKKAEYHFKIYIFRPHLHDDIISLVKTEVS